jgi:hypothetical protein
MLGVGVMHRLGVVAEGLLGESLGVAALERAPKAKFLSVKLLFGAGLMVVVWFSVWMVSYLEHWPGFSSLFVFLPV